MEIQLFDEVGKFSTTQRAFMVGMKKRLDSILILLIMYIYNMVITIKVNGACLGHDLEGKVGLRHEAYGRRKSISRHVGWCLECIPHIALVLFVASLSSQRGEKMVNHGGSSLLYP